MADPAPVSKRGQRYQQRMAQATSDKDRALAEFDALRQDAKTVPAEHPVWTQLFQALRAARTQLKPRR